MVAFATILLSRISIVVSEMEDELSVAVLTSQNRAVWAKV